MSPTDAMNFTWSRDVVKEEKGSVGALAWADLDNNGWNELIVPDYDSSIIEIFKFSAKTTESFL